MTSLALLTLGMFAAMVGLVFLGHSFGARRQTTLGDSKVRGNVVDGAVFGLLSLLLAFSFNGAVNRLDTHRQLIADEVTVIGTVAHRIDMLPEAARPGFRQALRDYVQSRVDVYAAKLDPNSEAAKRSALLREQLWQLNLAACRDMPCPVPTITLMSTALDEMFAFPVKQSLMARMHPPNIVFAALYGLALLCAFLVGYDVSGVRTSTWHYAFTFPFTMTAMLWVILDVEYPRLGINRLQQLEDLLVSLLKDF